MPLSHAAAAGARCTHPLMQKRFPVGLGPSPKTWPKWPPHLTTQNAQSQSAAVCATKGARRTHREQRHSRALRSPMQYSSWRVCVTAPGSVSKKLGQPGA